MCFICWGVWAAWAQPHMLEVCTYICTYIHIYMLLFMDIHVQFGSRCIRQYIYVQMYICVLSYPFGSQDSVSYLGQFRIYSISYLAQFPHIQYFVLRAVSEYTVFRTWGFFGNRQFSVFRAFSNIGR